eukprot:366009-Chlamydomonas_euryale.AAC.15
MFALSLLDCGQDEVKVFRHADVQSKESLMRSSNCRNQACPYHHLSWCKKCLHGYFLSPNIAQTPGNCCRMWHTN